MDQAVPIRLMTLLPLMAIGLVTLAVVGWVIWFVISAAASAWAKARQAKRQHELKVLMIERGMSADEMERILAAGGGEQIRLPQSSETPPAKPQEGPMKWPVHSNN